MPFYPLLWSIKLGTYTETMQGGETATTFSTEDLNMSLSLLEKQNK